MPAARPIRPNLTALSTVQATCASFPNLITPQNRKHLYPHCAHTSEGFLSPDAQPAPRSGQPAEHSVRALRAGLRAVSRPPGVDLRPPATPAAHVASAPL